jgi:hypothetical protein
MSLCAKATAPQTWQAFLLVAQYPQQANKVRSVLSQNPAGPRPQSQPARQHPLSAERDPQL